MGRSLLTQGGPHRHRAVAQILQHGTTAQRVGISPSRARELDRGRIEALRVSSVLVWGKSLKPPALAPRPHPAQTLRYTL